MQECTRPHKLNTAVPRRVRTAQKDTAGRMWPAGRSLPTPRLGVGYSLNRVINTIHVTSTPLTYTTEPASGWAF